MKSEELEVFFNARLQNILHQHLKLVVNEKDFKGIEKERHIDLVLELLQELQNHLEKEIDYERVNCKK